MPLSAWVGVALAVAAFAYVVYPLVAPSRGGTRPAGAEIATAPRREVSDEEIEAAIRLYRERETAGVYCTACGLRPEADALFCSSCGRGLEAPAPR